MKAHAQKQSQPKQEASLHPNRPTQHTPEKQAVRGGAAQASAEGRKVIQPGTPPPPPPPPPATTGFAHDFSLIPAHSKGPVNLQAKLTVNMPGDIYEQEADRVAERVTSMPEPQLQRACACNGGGCPACRSEHADQERLQTKRVQPNASMETTAPPIVHEVLRSSGQPLGATTRAFMEPRFGYDFSHVRVHTDTSAANAASAITARAFTVNRDIVFGAGEYAPQTQSGRSLLSHELTHVVQQRASIRLNERVRQADVHYEHRTGAVAERTVQRQSSEKLPGLSAQTAHTEKGKQASLDDDKAIAIRDELKKKGGYSKDVLDEMMEIERQMAASLVAFNSQKLDDLVLEIEIRWVLVETMKLIDKYLKEGYFQFPDQDTGYMISQSYWKPMSEPFEPRQGGTALAGEHGYQRNVFRPDYNSLAIRPTAAQAVDAIFTKSRNNSIVLDCNAMMVAMQYRAIEMAFRPEQFNKMFPENKQGLYIGPVGDPEQKVYPDYKSSEQEGDKEHPFLELGLYTKKDYSAGYFDEEKVEKELVIGDWVYFKNHEDYKEYAPSGMWQGEHAVYVGDGKFMGAGLAKKTGAANVFTYNEVLDELQDHYERAYDANKEKHKTKPKLTRDKLPGIVVRLVPNVKALKKLPKVTK